MDSLDLCVNHKGKDVVVKVNLETANMLLNDPEAAYDFMENFLKEKHEKEKKYELSDSEPLGSDEEIETKIDEREPKNYKMTNVPSDKPQEKKVYEIWRKKKPDETDHTATLFFLDLRQRLSKKFDDKCTTKNNLWHKIAKEMEDAGFNLGNQAAERCRQKFSNMQKQYIAYKKHMRTTGKEHRDPPPFYDQLDEILGYKDKVDPNNLQDSLAVPEESTDSDITGGECSTSSLEAVEAIKNRFANVKKDTKPHSFNKQLCELMVQHHKEEMNQRSQHFDSLRSLVETQNEQRERMLQLMASFMKKD